MKLSRRIMIAVLLVLIALVGSLFLYYHSPVDTYWLVCAIYKFTGYYCPGCGSGRACYSILHGQFYQALRYNAAACLLLPFIIIYFGGCFLQWVATGGETISKHIPRWIPYVLLLGLLLFGVLRNIDMYPFNLLIPTKIA